MLSQPNSVRCWIQAVVLLLVLARIVEIGWSTSHRAQWTQRGDVASSEVEAAMLENASGLSSMRDNDVTSSVKSLLSSPSTKQNKQTKYYYLLPIPEITTWLLGNFSESAYAYYETALNEEQAEIWLHRSLQEEMHRADRAHNRWDRKHRYARTHIPDQADVVIITGYLHLNHFLWKQQRKRSSRQTASSSASSVLPLSPDDWVRLVQERLIQHKPHVVAVPTWNPTRGNEIGLNKLQKMLDHTVGAASSSSLSLGFERNPFWQKVPDPLRIVPIPYVVTPHQSRRELQQLLTATFGASAASTAASVAGRYNRINNFIFYAGDTRKHAVKWAGCNRSQILQPLIQHDHSGINMDVRLFEAPTKASRLAEAAAAAARLNATTELSVSTAPILPSSPKRLTFDEYHTRMMTSDYCLIVCGDTPTSRSLASSMLYGCIPVFVGSRWRGTCHPPCHSGWGWTVTNVAHLPLAQYIDWRLFPELDEAAFIKEPFALLDDLFRNYDKVRKDDIRSAMQRVQMAFVYGWGNPVNATEFGGAVPYILESLFDLLATVG